MTTPSLGGASSIRIPDDVIARHPEGSTPAVPHTAAELARLLRLLRAAAAVSVAIGHGRDPASIAAAQAFAGEWEAGGGTVLVVVEWSADAASWLRPAQRLTRPGPDAWVIADTPAGTAQIGRRLADQEPGVPPGRSDSPAPPEQI